MCHNRYIEYTLMYIGYVEYNIYIYIYIYIYIFIYLFIYLFIYIVGHKAHNSEVLAHADGQPIKIRGRLLSVYAGFSSLPKWVIHLSHF